MIHIHTEVENLKYFSSKHGVCAYSNRAIAFAMQGANIVGVFYTKQQMINFYEWNKHKEYIEPIYYWDEALWDQYHGQNETTNI